MERVAIIAVPIPGPPDLGFFSFLHYSSVQGPCRACDLPGRIVITDGEESSAFCADHARTYLAWVSERL